MLTSESHHCGHTNSKIFLRKLAYDKPNNIKNKTKIKLNVLLLKMNFNLFINKSIQKHEAKEWYCIMFLNDKQHILTAVRTTTGCCKMARGRTLSGQLLQRMRNYTFTNAHKSVFSKLKWTITQQALKRCKTTGSHFYKISVSDLLHGTSQHQ